MGNKERIQVGDIETDFQPYLQPEITTATQTSTRKPSSSYSSVHQSITLRTEDMSWSEVLYIFRNLLF